MTTIIGTGTNPGEAGVYGESQEAEGVRGVGHKGAGVSGTSEKWVGVYGESQEAEGVRGVGHKGAGVSGTSEQYVGVWGESQASDGVQGRTSSNAHSGVAGIASSGIGVFGSSQASDGVQGRTSSNAHSGVAGIAPSGIGVFGSGRIAGLFQGDVEVTGDIRLTNADCAEDFDIAGIEKIEPGTVMVLNQEGTLQQSQHAYDKKVAGVISGAGDYKPAIRLDQRASTERRLPIALMGKVYCKADASYGAIAVGDLLTTSPTPGHAMKADDHLKAFGAVIGKALRPLKTGHGLIPILIALQ